MSIQLKLDFSQPRIPAQNEDREKLITFRTGEKFKDDLTAMAEAKGIGVSALIFEYAIKGYTEDYKNLLLLQAHADKPLREMLR